MNVWVPFTHIQPVTDLCLRDIVHERWRLDQSDRDSYRRYWAARWDRGISFVNVEHDVVFWPGALEAMWLCPAPWCAYGYSLNDRFVDHKHSLFPYIGCVKVGIDLIRATPDMWAAPVDWLVLDGHLAEHARAAGFDVHQHFPPVINANPVLFQKG